MIRVIYSIIGLIGIIPYHAHAQNFIGSQTSGGSWGSVKDIVESIGGAISAQVMPIVVALAVLYFMWNMAHFIGNMDNEKEREAFKKYSLNGVLALFILLSVWGIVAIGTRTLFNSEPIVPQFKTNLDV